MLIQVLNEYKLSECTMAMALAGHYDVPCIFVSGDDKICKEVKQVSPDTITKTVKWGIAAQNAMSLIPSKACSLIYEGVTEALEKIKQAKAFKTTPPYTLNISDRNPNEYILKNTVEGEDLFQVFTLAMTQINNRSYGKDVGDDGFRWPS